MKLYTRHGDTGSTSLVGGERVPKDDLRISACGDLDELNAHVGKLLSSGVPQREALLLGDVQEQLFNIGAELSNSQRRLSSQLKPKNIQSLELSIDTLQATTPDPQTFILPGGCNAATQAHICRTVCRRAERSVVTMARQHDVDPIILQYINRLSDYFFVLALYLNFIASVDEKKLYISFK